MAYNLKLAERIRSQLEGLPFVEKKMFGGTGYLLQGNMACGVLDDGLIVPRGSTRTCRPAQEAAYPLL